MQFAIWPLASQLKYATAQNQVSPNTPRSNCIAHTQRWLKVIVKNLFDFEMLNTSRWKLTRFKFSIFL